MKRTPRKIKPEDLQMLINAGISKAEIDAMSDDEKNNIIEALLVDSKTRPSSSSDSSDSSTPVEEINEYSQPHNSFNGDLDEDQAFERALKKSVMEVVTKPEEEENEIDETFMLPKRIDIKQNDQINVQSQTQWHLSSELRVAQNRNMTFEGLQVYRKNILSEFLIYDSYSPSVYKDKIKIDSQEIPPAPPYGITVIVMTIDGHRLIRRFNFEDFGRHIYLWCASTETLIQVNQRPSSFVIVNKLGQELKPRTLLKDFTGNTSAIMVWIRLITNVY